MLVYTFQLTLTLLLFFQLHCVPKKMLSRPWKIPNFNIFSSYRSRCCKILSINGHLNFFENLPKFVHSDFFFWAARTLVIYFLKIDKFNTNFAVIRIIFNWDSFFLDSFLIIIIWLFLFTGPEAWLEEEIERLSTFWNYSIFEITQFLCHLFDSLENISLKTDLGNSILPRKNIINI